MSRFLVKMSHTGHFAYASGQCVNNAWPSNRASMSTSLAAGVFGSQVPPWKWVVVGIVFLTGATILAALGYEVSPLPALFGIAALFMAWRAYKRRSTAQS